MSGERILLVEDDARLRLAVGRYLTMRDYELSEAATCASAVRTFTAKRPDVVITDYNLPDGNGVELSATLREIDRYVPIVVLTGHGTIELAVEAIKEGAEQFLTKPVQLAAFLLVVDRVLENQRNRRARLREEARRERERVDPFLGGSAAVRSLADRARRVADSNVPILIHGETGTGKGVLAAWLHRQSARADECFLDLNCAGLSPEFLESELFGHEKGSFTGAVAAKLGLLEVADRGTLFLDEIGDVPLAVQPKLLKVLEEKKFRRLGDVRERRVDIRLIAASHENLLALVERQRFRKDLYFRINTVVLEIPPLRERPEDLVGLADAFLQEIARDLGRESVRLSPSVRMKLESHSWPGNVRELRNALERAALLFRGPEIGPDDLGFEAGSSQERAAGPSDLSLLETEKDLIRKALAAQRGRVESAAQSLGISRSSLYQKIRKYGIVVSRN
jgi:DNA-binding NtrC family response regulator